MKQKYLPVIAAICTSVCLWQNGIPWIPNNVLIGSSRAEAQVPTKSEWQVLSKIDRDLLAFLASTGVIDQNSGALGQNRSGFISAGYQRYGSRFVTYGILTENVQLIDLGLRSIEYALRYQNADGSFIDYLPGVNGVSHPGSVAFYLHDTGHSLVLCKNSKWFQQSPETAALRARIERLKTPLTKSLNWLIAREADLIRGDGNGNGTNRLWVDANAYYLMGRALNRTDSVRLGEKIANLALQQQNAAGAFLEKKGFDSSYQAVSLHQALIFYTNLSSQANQRPIVWEAIQRGMRLEYRYLLPNGEVETKGNTRVYTGGESYLGYEKSVDYLAVVQSLRYYYELTQDINIKNAADRSWAYYRRPK
jgi:hypothetical protein